MDTVCPHPTGPDHRRTAAIAARHARHDPRTLYVAGFGAVRAILRDPGARQTGPGADLLGKADPEHIPVFYLDGETHRRRRATVARFFTPKAIAMRHESVMRRVTGLLIARFTAAGEARLDDLSYELAIAVAAEIIGLTESDQAAMGRRLSAMLATSGGGRLVDTLRRAWNGYRFLTRDVRPALRARRESGKEDLISTTIEQGYTERETLVDAITYASAGMLTTREFIVMVAWQLFEQPDLRTGFLAGDERRQFAILREILRIDPIATWLWRRTEAGAHILDIRAANLDETAAGSCPYTIDPDRAATAQDSGDFLSFGDGPHRCPGAQIALHETRIFINHLFRLPGLRLVRAPDILWNENLMSYELRRALIACDPS